MMLMLKADLKIISLSEARVFLGEKVEKQGSIALATLTRYESFAAKNNWLMKGKLF